MGTVNVTVFAEPKIDPDEEIDEGGIEWGG